MIKDYLFYSLSILFFFSCTNKEITPNYEEFVVGDRKLNYRILYPKNFDSSKIYPVKLFLHGIGERGDNNESQLTYVDKVFLNPKLSSKNPAHCSFPILI